MAEQQGKLLTCDRCGKQIFLKHLKREDLNGGFDHREVYEETPEGWYSRNVGKDFVSKYALLCPECNRLCGELLTGFMGGRESVNDK